MDRDLRRIGVARTAELAVRSAAVHQSVPLPPMARPDAATHRARRRTAHVADGLHLRRCLDTWLVTALSADRPAGLLAQALTGASPRHRGGPVACGAALTTGAHFTRMVSRLCPHDRSRRDVYQDG